VETIGGQRRSITFAFCFLLLLAVPFTVPGEMRPSISIFPDEPLVQVGQEITVQIEARGMMDLYAAPFHLTYDSSVVQAIRVEEGHFLKHGGKKTLFLHKINPDRGNVIIGLSRIEKSVGVTGQAPLVFVTFKTMKEGRTRLGFQNVAFKNSKKGDIVVHPKEGWIEVQ
jgi:hypothetical protein